LPACFGHSWVLFRKALVGVSGDELSHAFIEYSEMKDEVFAPLK